MALFRTDSGTANLGNDYAGLIETTLAAVYHHSRHFARLTSAPLHVTGGAAASPGILRRIASIWRRPVISMENAGAALGAAVAGTQALFKSTGREFDVEEFSLRLLKRGIEIQPLSEDVAAFHAPGGFLAKFAAEEAKLIEAYPLVKKRRQED